MLTPEDRAHVDAAIRQLAAEESGTAPRTRVCAHADADGAGMHMLAAGERCGNRQPTAYERGLAVGAALREAVELGQPVNIRLIGETTTTVTVSAPERQPSTDAARLACVCQILDPAGKHETRVADLSCPVHKPRGVGAANRRAARLGGRTLEEGPEG